MATLSKPFYNASTVNSPTFTESTKGNNSSTESFESAFDTPYDAAKKRQSRLMVQQTNATSILDRTITEVPDYQIDGSRKKTDYHVKVVVVGDGGCGKTCLLISYSQGEFPTVYVPTIFENYVTQIKSPNGKYIELALWDTAGQEEYDRLRPLSYPDTNVLLICYAINNPTTLHNVKETWAPEVRHFCPGVPVILVGTKSDLLKEGVISNCVTQMQGRAVAQQIGASAHIRCSAKTTNNVNQVFNVAVNLALNNMDQYVQDLQQKTLKNRISKQFKRSQLQEKDNHKEHEAIVSDYYKNSEYGIDQSTKTKKKKSKKCIIF